MPRRLSYEVYTQEDGPRRTVAENPFVEFEPLLVCRDMKSDADKREARWPGPSGNVGSEKDDDEGDGEQDKCSIADGAREDE